eukprot:4395560-Amphidinium_carterae.1
MVGAHPDSELSKQLPVPNTSDGITVVYLDSFDYLRAVPKLSSQPEKKVGNTPFFQSLSRFGSTAGKSVLEASAS